MTTYVFLVRFSWTANGVTHVDRAGDRRRSAMLAADAAGIQVLSANFLLDGQDHIQWTVAVDDTSPALAKAQITNLWNNVFLNFAHPFVTSPKPYIQISP
jgi:hypothetical protein